MIVKLSNKIKIIQIVFIKISNIHSFIPGRFPGGAGLCPTTFKFSKQVFI